MYRGGKESKEDKALKSLLNKLNKVTSYHRHGKDIPKKALDDLANSQIEYEKLVTG